MPTKRALNPPQEYRMKTETMAWRAVRCCCVPAKVLGFLQLPADDLNFVLLDLMGGRHTIELRTAQDARIDGLLGERYITIDLAIYSEYRAIEFWRQIRGFLEVTHG